MIDYIKGILTEIMQLVKYAKMLSPEAAICHAYVGEARKKIMKQGAVGK